MFPMAWDSGIIAVVAVNVRRLRKGLSLSQEELGFVAKLDRTYVSLVERQKRNISISVLARLAKALKVRPAELVEPPPKRR
jgi:transcriptional regulator with XRE-family HTH domain